MNLEYKIREFEMNQDTIIKSKDEWEIAKKFLEDHKNAKEIICTKEGTPLFALYITPWGANQEKFKNIMRLCKERMVYYCDDQEYFDEIKEN